MIVQTSLGALASGQQVQLSVGDTLRVSVSFNYTVSESTSVTIRCCPHQRVMGILDRIGSCCGETQADLSGTVTPAKKEVTVDCVMLPASEGGIGDGTYGLIAEIPGYDAEETIENCIVISGNPASVMDMIPMLMMVMVMGMMMGTMEGV